jgi:hypothetical protein
MGLNRTTTGPVEERRQLVLDAPVECGLMDWCGSHLPAIRHYGRLYDKPVIRQLACHDGATIVRSMYAVVGSLVMGKEIHERTIHPRVAC